MMYDIDLVTHICAADNKSVKYTTATKKRGWLRSASPSVYQSVICHESNTRIQLFVRC